MKTLLLFVLASCLVGLPAQIQATYDSILKVHVNKSGKVDYNALKRDSNIVNTYCALLTSNPLSDSCSEAEKLCYWINTYNAFTLKLIIDNYPIKSITDLHPTISIPGISRVWHRKFFEINGEPFSLDRIEHKVLRTEFKEPLIHFAINCASLSCPCLKNSTYKPQTLDQDLEKAVRQFLSDSSKNIITPNELQLSAIFNWFETDFEKEGGVIAFIQKYTSIKLKKNISLMYLKYNWKLNDSKAHL